ncbi:MAG: hypothetical protein H7Y42_04220 [Chitinophagaceae bacterium]|nr:hypothetical protein [Chitinophagaceae bacterium]
MRINSNTLKLAYLLAQYLYTNKRLDLPGIGTFLLDPTVTIEPENSKQRSSITEGISFKNNPAIQDSPELISFISTTSGKMKALAIADLASHLELAHQFLNIGKPFLFDGIGNLVKMRAGEFEFTPGTMITDKIMETGDKEVHGLTRKETVDAKYQAYLATPTMKTPWRKPVIALLIICGIGLAIWGGYTIATRNSESDEALTEAIENTTPLIDTTQATSLLMASNQKTEPTDSYKYVLEVAKERRAFRRFNQLKENQWEVKIETADSVQYKLYMLLPATSDTTRVLDSLTVMTGKKVYIEQN